MLKCKKKSFRSKKGDPRKTVAIALNYKACKSFPWGHCVDVQTQCAIEDTPLTSHQSPQGCFMAWTKNEAVYCRSCVAQNLVVAQNRTQYGHMTNHQQKALGACRGIIQSTRTRTEQGAKLKFCLTVHDIVQNGVFFKVATCCINVAVFP